LPNKSTVLGCGTVNVGNTPHDDVNPADNGAG
jgi:hypothetical protein